MKKNPKNEDEYLFTEAGIIFMLKKTGDLEDDGVIVAGMDNADLPKNS